MKFDLATGKRRFKVLGSKISKASKGLSTSIKKYNAEAPQRRAAEITRLKQDIQIEKLKAQKRKLQKKDGIKYDPFAGF